MLFFFPNVNRLHHKQDQQRISFQPYVQQTVPVKYILAMSTSDSVFDRLYSKSTESSRSRTSAKETESSTAKTVSSKRVIPRNNQTRPAAPPKTYTYQSKSNSGSSDVFSRLYSSGTESYNSKRKI